MKKRVSLLALMVALLLLFTACQDTTTATEAAADADSAVKTMTGEETDYARRRPHRRSPLSGPI